MITRDTTATPDKDYFPEWKRRLGLRSAKDTRAYMEEYFLWVRDTYAFHTAEEHHAHAPQVVATFLRHRIARYPWVGREHMFVGQDPALVAEIAQEDVQDAMNQWDRIRGYHIRGGWGLDGLDLGEEVDIVAVMRGGLSFNQTHNPAKSRRTGYPEQRLVLFAHENDLQSRSGVLHHWKRERESQPTARDLAILVARSRSMQDMLAAANPHAIIVHAVDGRTIMALSERTASALADVPQ